MNKKFNTKFKIIFLFIFISSILLSKNACSKNQTKIAEKKKIYLLKKGIKFLKKNKAEIITDFKYEDLSLFDNDLINKNVICIGESHGIKYNFILYYKLISYLTKKHNLKYILLETSYPMAELYNMYINSGNREIFDIIYKNNYLSYDSSIAFINLLNKIKELNSKLPALKKIKIIGFDTNPEYVSVELLLLMLENKKYISENLKSLYNLSKNKDRLFYLYFHNKEEYKKYKKEFFKNYKTYFFHLYNDLNKNKEKYKKYFKNDFYKFEKIVYYQYSILFDNKVENRDKFIFNNIKKEFLNKINNKNKLLIIYGRQHFDIFGKLNHAKGQYKFLRDYLNEIRQFKNKIIYTAIFYKNCNYNYYNILTFQSYKLNEEKKYNNFFYILDKATKSDITIYKLKGKNSPFEKWNFLSNSLEDYIKKSEIKTTYYWDFVFYVKNSPPLKLYKKIDNKM